MVQRFIKRIRLLPLPIYGQERKVPVYGLRENPKGNKEIWESPADNEDEEIAGCYWRTCGISFNLRTTNNGLQKFLIVISFVFLLFSGMKLESYYLVFNS